MKDFGDVVGALVFIALIGAGFLGALLDRASCNATARAMHVPARWSLLTSCMIEYEPGKWVPLENYRGVHAKELK